MNTIKPIILIATICAILSPSSSFACDTTPTEVAQNIQYAGKGLYSIDIENCIGDAGSENGFTIGVSGVNIVEFSSDTIQNVLNGNMAFGTLSNGIINYDYASVGYFVDLGQNSCFSHVVIVDDYPAESIVTFTGVNSPDNCAILDGDTQTTPVIETPSCGNTFYDTGGADGIYANDEDYSVVICGGAGPVELQFTLFELALDGDIMIIYDNDTLSGPSDFYTGSSSPGTVTSTNPTNCLTVAFESNSFGDPTLGWAAEVICDMPCPNGLTVDVVDDLRDGEVCTIVSGGNLPYTFIWNTGDNTYNTDIVEEGVYIVSVVDNSGCVAVDSILITSVSVIQPEDCEPNDEDCSSTFGLIDVYPNPAQEDINITFEIQNNQEVVQLKLIDMMGRTLQEQKIAPDIGFNKTLIDVSNLTTAMYFIVIDDGTRQSVTKFFKG